MATRKKRRSAKTSGELMLGDSVKCRVTATVGIAIARYIYLNGCNRIEVQPQRLKDGMPVASVTIDELQLDVVKRGAVSVHAPGTGGPASNPQPRSTPKR